MANTDEVQGQKATNNNSSADDFTTNSVTYTFTNVANNNKPIDSQDCSEDSPLMRYFDFDDANYSYVLGYN